MKSVPVHRCDEAAPVRNGSDADGYAVKAGGLPLAVVGLHVHFLAFDHSEMTADKNVFLSCFPALCARALFKLNSDRDTFHKMN